MTAGASTSPVYDFTSLDYTSAEEDFTRFAQATFPAEQWTDFNDSNFASGLLAELAYATDLLAYAVNSQNLETIISACVREQNFRNLGKSFDYALNSASASSTTMRLTLDPVGSYPFTVSKHLQFSTTDSIVFQPDADTAVAAYGAGYVDVAATQGEESYLEVLGTTTGAPNEKFSLLNADLIDGTLVVDVGLDAYTAVVSFAGSNSTDKVYILETSEAGITSVIFGDGINGNLPPSGQTTKATYKAGGGSATNLAVGTITRVFGTSDGSALPAQVLSVTNTTASTGGSEKQSLLSARQNLPLTIKANDRCVTLQDYAATAVDLVPGVLKASAVSGKPLGGSTPILLFVVPNGGGNPSDSLRNLTIVNLKDKRLAGKRIRVLDPVYVNMIIEADTFIQPNSPALDTANKHRDILAAKYALEAVDFGSTFDLQDAYDSASPAVISGIKRVFYRTFTIEAYYARHVNSPTSGNGTIPWIDTTRDTVKRREWLLEVTPATGPVLVRRFKVKQRILGTVTSVTDNLVTDESADFDANLLATEGWYFHPKPEDTASTFLITGNTASTITTASGLLVETEPDDPYVVEKEEPRYGKILRSTLTSAVSSSNVIPLDSILSWEVGDHVHFTDADNLLEIFVIASINVPGLTVTLDRIVSSASGAHMDYVWESQDESVRFSCVDGTTPFVVGDQLYVDTYARTGDIILRSENYPLLTAANLFVNPVGGVR
jgi:hypothetical protein